MKTSERKRLGAYWVISCRVLHLRYLEKLNFSGMKNHGGDLLLKMQVGKSVDAKNVIIQSFTRHRKDFLESSLCRRMCQFSFLISDSDKVWKVLLFRNSLAFLTLAIILPAKSQNIAHVCLSTVTSFYDQLKNHHVDWVMGQLNFWRKNPTESYTICKYNPSSNKTDSICPCLCSYFLFHSSF